VYVWHSFSVLAAIATRSYLPHTRTVVDVPSVMRCPSSYRTPNQRHWGLLRYRAGRQGRSCYRTCPCLYYTSSVNLA